MLESYKIFIKVSFWALLSHKICIKVCFIGSVDELVHADGTARNIHHRKNKTKLKAVMVTLLGNFVLVVINLYAV